MKPYSEKYAGSWMICFYPNLDKPKPKRAFSSTLIYLCFGFSKLASKIYLIIFYFINSLIFSIAFTLMNYLNKFCQSTLPFKFLPRNARICMVRYYTIDIAIYESIDNPDLIDHIKRVGIIFYRNNEQSSQ
jgi:hypothetical protein